MVEGGVGVLWRTVPLCVGRSYGDDADPRILDLRKKQTDQLSALMTFTTNEHLYARYPE
jgi:hypothetical protein